MPSMRACLRTPYRSRSTGSGSGFSGAAALSERCGRCWLWWVSYLRSIRRRWAWSQTSVRSRSSRRHPPIQRSAMAFMRGVRTLQSTVRMPASADRVERGGVVRAAVPDHELDPVRLLAEVHDQVAGLLGSPVPGWMQGDSEDADAPGGVLDHGQDISLGAVEQVGREEVTGQDRFGLGAQELRPGRTCPPRRGVDPGLLQDFPHGRRRHLHSQAGQLTVDPAVPPVRVLASQPQDQGPDVPAGGWPAGPAAQGPGGPAAADDIAMPAHDRVRGDQQPQPLAPRFRDHAEQGR